MPTSNLYPDTLGPGDAIGEGDAFVLYEFLPQELADTAFERITKEVRWNKMMHRGGEVPRLVAVEGHILQDGSYPIYRHPADESPPLLPFSPTVERIRQHVENVLREPVNHVLIQHYRNGADYISEHPDKGHLELEPPPPEPFRGDANKMRSPQTAPSMMLDPERLDMELRELGNERDQGWEPGAHALMERNTTTE